MSCIAISKLTSTQIAYTIRLLTFLDLFILIQPNYDSIVRLSAYLATHQSQIRLSLQSSYLTGRPRPQQQPAQSNIAVLCFEKSFSHAHFSEHNDATEIPT